MPVNTANRDTAGADYAAKLSAFVAAYVELAATERALESQGIDCSGGRLHHCGGVDLIPFRHPKFAPRPDAPRLEDQIQARLAKL